jgi:hypothetical protein
MTSNARLWLLLLFLLIVAARDVETFRQTVLSAQEERPGWYDPRENGGSMLDVRCLLFFPFLSFLYW